MNNQYDVFISYKSEEIEFAEKVTKFLEDKGINVWYAPRNLDTGSSGRPYDDAIADVIKNVKVVIVLVSERSLNSEWVRMEVQRAEKTKRLIIPFVVAEYTTDNGLLMRLETLHMIQACPNFEEGLVSLHENVRRKTAENYKADDTERLPLDLRSKGKVQTGEDYAFEEGMALYDANEKMESVEFFLRSAQNGNDKAKKLLCELFYEQNRDLSNVDEALWNTIEAISDQGEAYAYFLMHCKYYAMGNQNVIALRYLQKALEKEPIPLALLRMGISYNWGMGVKQNHILGVYYYKKALEKGCKYAYSYIAQEYAWGSDKIEKSLEKANEYLLKGIEMGDNRCYSRLSNLYVEEPEKYYELAQKMIDDGVSGGYSMMAEYYAWYAPEEKRDEGKALEKAHEALDKNENGAYGLISALYYNDGERQEAEKYARIGVEQGSDGYAYYMLAIIRENDDEDYADAWLLYMTRYEKFGNGSEDLGRLYLEKGYRPDNFSVDDLKQILTIGARNYDLDSLKYLLCLFVLERYGDYEPFGLSLCDKLKDIPEAYDFIHLGSEMDDVDFQMIQGRIMVESSGFHYNPHKGCELVEKVAENSLGETRKDAIAYLMIHSKGEMNRKWVETGLKEKVDLLDKDEKTGELLLDRVFETVGDAGASDWVDYLEWASRELGFGKEHREALYKLMKHVLSLYKNNKVQNISNHLKKFMYEEVMKDLDKPNLFCKISSYFDVFIPRFDKERIIEQWGGEKLDDVTRQLFVYACADLSRYKYTDRRYLDDVYKPLATDSEFIGKLKEQYDYRQTETKALNDTMNEFVEHFDKVCDHYDYSAAIMPMTLDYLATIPYVNPGLLINIARNRIDCLLEIMPLIDKEIRDKIVSCLFDQSKILDIAEMMAGPAELQLLLIVYVENMIEINAVFSNQTNIIDAYLKESDEGRKIVGEKIDAYRKRVEEYQNKRESESECAVDEVDEDTENEEEKRKQTEAFNRLLDEFLEEHMDDKDSNK